MIFCSLDSEQERVQAGERSIIGESVSIVVLALFILQTGRGGIAVVCCGELSNNIVYTTRLERDEAQ